MKKLWLTVALVSLFLVMLTGVLFADKYRSSQWKKLARDVKLAVVGADRETVVGLIRKVGEDDSKRAVELLVQLGLQVTDPDVYSEIKQAMAGVTNKKALRQMAKFVRKHRDIRIRIMLVEVLGRKGDKEFVDEIGAILTGKKKGDMSLICTAIEALADIGGKESLRYLVDYLAKIEAERKGSRLMGTDWHDCRLALKHITGGEADYTEVADWKNYIETLPEDWKPKEKQQEEQPETAKVKKKNLDFKKGKFSTAVVMPNKVPPLFGNEVTSRTPVFVIDVSGSMTWKDPPSPGSKKKGGGEEVKGTKTALGGQVKKKLKPAAQPGGQKGQPGGQQDALGDDRMRIVRVQIELVKLVRALDAGVRFNIIAYERIVHPWSKTGLKAATPANKASAIKFINGFQATATTHTDDALEKAWENIKDGCDTMYLLSDGSPTHKGDCSDSDMLVDEILNFFRMKNKFRKVRIFTLGFKDANVPFMTRLAKENNGKYSDIK